jgi:outer membrane protein
LFASGVTQSRVRETLALRDKAQSDVDVARRTVSLAVRQAFSGTLSARAQAQGLEAAVRSQELALRVSRRAYELGTKANADVLDAQSRLFEARRDLSRARYDAWNNFIKLKAQSGQLAESDLAQLDAQLLDLPSEPFLTPHR